MGCTRLEIPLWCPLPGLQGANTPSVCWIQWTYQTSQKGISSNYYSSFFINWEDCDDWFYQSTSSSESPVLPSWSTSSQFHHRDEQISLMSLRVVVDVVPAALWEQHQALSKSLRPGAMYALVGDPSGSFLVCTEERTFFWVNSMPEVCWWGQWPPADPPCPFCSPCSANWVSPTLFAGNSCTDVVGLSPWWHHPHWLRAASQVRAPLPPAWDGGWGISFCSNTKVLPGGKACLFLSRILGSRALPLLSVQFPLECYSYFLSVCQTIIKTDNCILWISILSPINIPMKPSLKFLNLSFFFVCFHLFPLWAVQYIILLSYAKKYSSSIVCLWLQFFVYIEIYFRICMVYQWHYTPWKTRCKY